MADILRIKRRAAGGAAGPPATLNAAELAYNEQDDTLYYGKGNSSGAATSIIAVAGAPAQNNVGRNIIQNPYFNVAQRGAGTFTAFGYTLDRWAVQGSGGTLSCGRNALLDSERAQIGDEAAKFYFVNTFTGGSAAGDFTAVMQPIEDVRRLAGKTVILSFWAGASASLKLGAAFIQAMGSGGSPSASVNINGQSVTVSGTWTRYSLTFTLPSLTGKTLGTNDDSRLALYLCYSSGSTNNTFFGSVGVQSGTITIWGVQLEIGSVATPLEKIDPGEDLRRCQRFYQANNVATLSFYGTTAWGYSYDQLLPVTMRATPTITITSTPSYTNASNASAAAHNSGSVSVSAQAATAGNYAASFYYSASADL